MNIFPQKSIVYVFDISHGTTRSFDYVDYLYIKSVIPKILSYDG